MGEITSLQIILILAIVDAILSSIMIGLAAIVGGNSGNFGIAGGLIIFVFSMWAVLFVETHTKD